MLKSGIRHCCIFRRNETRHDILLLAGKLQDDERDILAIFHEIGHVYCFLLERKILVATVRNDFDGIPKGITAYAKAIGRVAYGGPRHEIFRETFGFFSGALEAAAQINAVDIFPRCELSNIFSERTAWAYALHLKRRLGLSLGFENNQEIFDFIDRSLRSYGTQFTRPTFPSI